MLRIKTGIKDYVDSLMMRETPFGRFRLAAKGCSFMPYDILSVHFAADIYSKLRLEHTLSAEHKTQWENLSISWINPQTGEVSDQNGLERAFAASKDRDLQINDLRRNLNRCCHGVFELGRTKCILQDDARKFLNIEKLKSTFESLPWDTNAWSAGAHAAHYILAMHEWATRGHSEFFEPIEMAVGYLYSKQNPQDGTFGAKGQSDMNLIGGMLKIGIRLFVTLGLELKYPERMIDTAIRMLESGTLQGNCPAHNALIVLEMCSNFTNYRHNDIKTQAIKSLERDIIPLYKPDGGFCNALDTSEYWIWNVKMVNAGYDQSNLHSTNLMLNAIRVIAEITGIDSELGLSPSDYRLLC